MKNLNIEAIKTLLVHQFGSNVIEKEQNEGLQSSLTIQAEKIVEVCLFLKQHPDTYFDFLSSITGIDQGDGKFEIIYHLASIPFQTQLTLKVTLASSEDITSLPEIPSVSHVWQTANWHERETYDLMGIFFSNHPDLRRILLPDDWEGYPLRKDYQQASFYRGMPTN